MNPPTPAQLRMLKAIRAHWARYGVGPTIRDLMAATGIGSPNGVVSHLNNMLAKGIIEWDRKGAARQLWPAGLREKIRQLAKAG